MLVCVYIYVCVFVKEYICRAVHAGKIAPNSKIARKSESFATSTDHISDIFEFSAIFPYTCVCVVCVYECM